MPTISNAEVLFYLLAFIVPGFILQSTLSMLVPVKEENQQIAWVRFLTLSALNYAIWSWLVYLITSRTWIFGSQWGTALSWFWIIFISPVLLALLLGWLSQRDKIRRFLQRLGYLPVHDIPLLGITRLAGLTVKSGYWCG